MGHAINGDGSTTFETADAATYTGVPAGNVTHAAIDEVHEPAKAEAPCIQQLHS